MAFKPAWAWYDFCNLLDQMRCRPKSLIFFASLLALKIFSANLLWAEEKILDPTNEFIQILSGRDEQAPYTSPEVWKEKLLNILQGTQWSQLDPKEKIPETLNFKANYQMNPSTRAKIRNTYEVFKKFRSENLKSKWFINKALPEYIDEIYESFKSNPSVVCAPTERDAVQQIYQKAKADLEKMGTQSDLPRIYSSGSGEPLSAVVSESPGEVAVKVDPYAEWRKDWNPTKAAEFASYLWEHPEKMPALHLVSREDSLLSPPQVDPDRKNLTDVRRIIFHHSDTGRNATVRDIQRSHFNRYFSDIGYHFAIGQDPKTKEVVVFQGRDLGTQGAHAKNNNSDSIGIVFIGNFEPYDSMLNPTGVKTNASDHSTDPVLAPSLEQIAAGTALAYQLDHLGSAVMKIANDKGVNIQLERIQGHGDCAATENGTHTLCPGEGLKPFVKAMDAKVKEESAKAENQR